MSRSDPADTTLSFWQNLARWAEAMDETPEERLSRQIRHLHDRINALETALAAQNSEARQ